MKRLSLILVFLIYSLFLYSQTPQKFNYQTVVRDNTGTVIKNQIVSFRIAIVKNNPSGFEVYSESHTPTTNEFGLVNFEVGNGIIISGSMSSIEWGADIYFIKIGLDASGGSNYILMGTSQLLSVPYALYAEKAGNINNSDTSATNEIQDLQLTKSNLLLITNNPNANPINLNNFYDNTDSQKLSISGDTILISNGNKIVISDDVNDADADPQNEIQFLSFANDTLLLSNGSFAYLGNYDNLAAINQLFIKLAADSIYLKQLIDYNASSITFSQQNLNSLASKQQSDSATSALDIKSVSDDLATETSNRISGEATITAKHVSDSTLMANNLTSLNTGLNTETANRIAADYTLSNKDNSDSTYLRGLINTNINDISTEATNRITSDNSIKSKATTDSTFFKGLNDNLNTTLNAETSNRIASDNNISAKETADSSYLSGLINSNANNLNTHISNDADIDSTNEIQTLSRNGLNISLSKTSGSISVADNDNDSLNELQTLSISNDTLSISKGNFIELRNSTFSVPVGSIMPFAGTNVPNGWLLCNGDAISKSAYSNLFTIIGISWGGGNGTTTFNLPDLRGQFLRGVDGTGGIDTDKANRTAKYTSGNTGNSVGSYQEDEIRAHYHTYQNDINGPPYNHDLPYTAGGSNYRTNSTSSSTGGSETRPVNAYVNYIIKY